MKSKKTILISAAGGSFFPYTLDLLKDKYRLVLTDTSRYVKKIYPDQEVIIIPRADDEKFSAVIEKVITRYRIDFYIPLIDKEILKVLAVSKQVKRLKVISPNSNFVKLSLDKFELMKKLSKSGISQIKTCLGSDFKNQFNFPVFIKPIVSTGSRGAEKIISIGQLKAYFQFYPYKPNEVMIQEYLPGSEYTVSVVVNNLNQLMAIVPKKIIEKKGITQHAVTRENPAITKVCRKIVKILKPHGPINVQLKVVGQQVYIFEINPRFSTTTILTCQAGINEFQLCIENYDRKHVGYINKFNQGLHLYRNWDSHFFT